MKPGFQTGGIYSCLVLKPKFANWQATTHAAVSLLRLCGEKQVNLMSRALVAADRTALDIADEIELMLAEVDTGERTEQQLQDALRVLAATTKHVFPERDEHTTTTAVGPIPAYLPGREPRVPGLSFAGQAISGVYGSVVVPQPVSLSSKGPLGSVSCSFRQ